MLAVKLATAVAALAVQEASAHGKLTVPASRNELGSTSNCAHCLNGGGPCGDRSSLDFFAGPQARWTAGSIVPITVVVTAHHMGHYEFRVCDTVLNSSVADADGCLNRWVLQRATPEEAAAAFGLSPRCATGDVRPHCVPFDARHPERWYLPPRGEIGGTHTVYFRVPEGLQCDACTLQWHWWSANSCAPAGDYGCYKQVLQSSGYWVGQDKAAWWTAFGGACNGPAGPNGHSGCGEQFWNCADISVQRDAGPSPTPATTSAPTALPTTLPTASTTRASTQRPTLPPTTTVAPTSRPTGPAACGACQGAQWSSACAWTNGRCYPIAEDVCRRFQGTAWCGQGGAGTTTPAPTPTEAPTPAPTVAPTASPTRGGGAGSCPGEPCGSAQLCRSKWGFCGQGAPWCNDESTWRAEGCAPSLIAKEVVSKQALTSA